MFTYIIMQYNFEFLDGIRIAFLIELRCAKWFNLSNNASIHLIVISKPIQGAWNYVRVWLCASPVVGVGWGLQGEDYVGRKSINYHANLNKKFVSFFVW